MLVKVKQSKFAIKPKKKKRKKRKKIKVRLLFGKCEKVLKKLPSNFVDSIVTDCPYGISFMGKKWDYDVPSVKIWKEALRVLKPGGYLLCFGSTRTSHRIVTNIEDAGFEIRDTIAWVYGSGFPKSHNIGKAIDKKFGKERKVVGIKNNTYDGCKRTASKHKSPAETSNIGKWGLNETPHNQPLTAPTTKEAKQWEGWGTALKPAFEPITVARKPLSEKTIALNVLTHGTGGINIDKCRVVAYDNQYQLNSNRKNVKSHWATSSGSSEMKAHDKGRFPANFIHDGSNEVIDLFPLTHKAGNNRKSTFHKKQKNTYGKYGKTHSNPAITGDIGGSAARFFYCAKASKKERNEGLNDITNNHPTVKPIALMKYLVRLVTQPNGTVLDLFMGSGTTGKACMIERFNFVGIEKGKGAFIIAKERIYFELERSK